MPSDKQIAASRANGAKSRGPATPKGKLRSSRNSLAHGMLARTVVLESESRERFDALLKSLQDDLKPETAIENLLVHKMAVAHWRQMRVWGMEKACISHEAHLRGHSPEAPLEDAPTRDANAFHTSNAFMNEYEMRFDRQFSRALDHFERFRAARPKPQKMDSGKRTRQMPQTMAKKGTFEPG